ncbi:MAG: DNA/RNA nuclease SfsA [Bacillota bacterium]
MSKSDIEAKIVLPRLNEAVFLLRHNRFVGEVEIGGQRVLAHVPSSGRMAELLFPGARVFVAHGKKPGAKLNYRILLAENNGYRVSVDSLLPNRLIYRALLTGALPELGEIAVVKREAAYGRGRFDFFFWGRDGSGCYMEVKSVTLVEGGTALFPDAPSERGARHMEELAAALREGYRAVVLFVIQRSDARCFSPNRVRDPIFSLELDRAASAGVEVMARSCTVSAREVALGGPVPVIL